MLSQPARTVKVTKKFTKTVAILCYRLRVIIFFDQKNSLFIIFFCDTREQFGSLGSRRVLILEQLYYRNETNTNEDKKEIINHSTTAETSIFLERARGISNAKPVCLHDFQ